MAKALKSKYNSTGERCVNACLNYGELRFVNEDGSPVIIEIPLDKYEEAISDFVDRVREGMTQETLEPKDILKRGEFTYGQVKNIASEGKIRGLTYYEIDGSIECEHILGISGGLEYALALWNGNSKENAILKAIVRAIKVYGPEFIKSLNFDDSVDTNLYTKFAKSLHSLGSVVDIELFEIRSYIIGSTGHGINKKGKLINNLNLLVFSIGGIIGIGLVQLFTNFGKYIDNVALLLVLNSISFLIFGTGLMKLTKYITEKYVKNTTGSISEIFNEELDKASCDNLLTEKEAHIILRNITKGEVTKLLTEMKGSVNKKISCNTIVTKETKFILDARKMVILPTEHEIKEGLFKLVNSYESKLNNEYNINNI